MRHLLAQKSPRYRADRHLDKFDNGGAIGRRISCVCHIGDFLPRRNRHRVPQHAELRLIEGSRSGRDPDHIVIWSILDDCALQVLQPGADWQPQLQEFVFPDVDMRGFLNREGETRRSVIENGR